MANKRTYVVVLVGGKGRRLRPLSTAAVPKAFLSITKDRKTLFRKTLDRVNGLVPAKDTVVIANRAHNKLVRKDFPAIADENLILEPVSRNTAPAITLAASILEKRSPGAIMVVLPTDHYITEKERFAPALRRGIAFVKTNREAMLVIGVKPRYPSAHFGYIKMEGASPVKKSAHNAARGIVKVQRFVEKPDRKTAEKYLKTGDYLWNTGAFIFSAAALLKAVKKFSPGVYNSIMGSGDIGKVYRNVPDISIDYAVMEKARNVYCLAADYEWHDLGGFESLIKILTREKREFSLRGGKVVSIK